MSRQVGTAPRAASPAQATARVTGTVGMFRTAGFEEIGRTYASRPAMRRTFMRPSNISTITMIARAKSSAAQNSQ